MICCTVSILIKKIDDMLWTCMHKSGHHCYPHKLIDHTTSPKVHLYPAPGVLKLLPTLWRPGNLWNSLFPKVDLDRFRTILANVHQCFTITWFPQLKGWGLRKVSSIACTSATSAISSRSDLVAQCHELRESLTRNQRC